MVRGPIYKRRIIAGAGLLSAGLMFLVDPVFSQNVSGETVLKEIERQLSGVKDFSVKLEIVADIERLDVPPMHATLYFKRPDKIHLDSDGFAILPREASMLIVGGLADRFAATIDGLEDVDGRKCYRVGLTPRNAKGFRGTLTLFVDPERWTPERLATTIPGGRAATVTFEQRRIGDVWLTSKVTVQLETAEQDSISFVPPGMEDTPMRRQVPRNGTITITYSDYRVNTSLPDSIFAKDAARN